VLLFIVFTCDVPTELVEGYKLGGDQRNLVEAYELGGDQGKLI